MLEPIIWLLFGAGMMVGGLLLPAWALVMGLAEPLGIALDGALTYDHALRAREPPARPPRARSLRSRSRSGAAPTTCATSGSTSAALARDGLVGALCYGVALVGERARDRRGRAPLAACRGRAPRSRGSASST